MVVACTVRTKSNLRNKNLIIFLDAIKAWYLLSKQVGAPTGYPDEGAADGSLGARRGWLTLCERLIVIPWDARAAGAAKILLACLPQALRIRCILWNMFVDAVMRVVTPLLLNPVDNCLVSCDWRWKRRQKVLKPQTVHEHTRRLLTTYFCVICCADSNTKVFG